MNTFRSGLPVNQTETSRIVDGFGGNSPGDNKGIPGPSFWYPRSKKRRMSHSKCMCYHNEPSTQPPERIKNIHRNGTESDARRQATPRGMNTIPMTKKVIMTGTGVKIGCHALSCCCLNAVAANKVSLSHPGQITRSQKIKFPQK